MLKRKHFPSVSLPFSHAFPRNNKKTKQKQTKIKHPSHLSSMADWSQLPKDLLDLIAKHLDSPFYQLNKLRLRSVCSLWRSSTSDHRPRRSRMPFVPNDGFVTTNHDTFAFHLSKRTIFLITLPTDNNNSWLIKSQNRRIPLKSNSIAKPTFEYPDQVSAFGFPKGDKFVEFQNFGTGS